MVLAVGSFLVVLAAAYSTPILLEYITQYFPEPVPELSVIMSVYRQIFGPSLPFFIIAWVKRVGTGWYDLLPQFDFLPDQFASQRNPETPVTS